jgi:N-ethylmaleimide reductase
MSTLQLLSELRHEKISLKNRVFMAPMTRSRAKDQIPNDLMAQYYAQRASAGLIFSEASQISPEAVGYIFTPGIHTSEQVAGWKKITSAVHEKNGRIFCQLWHVGRVSHPDLQGGKTPVAPSAIGFKGTAFTSKGPKEVITPRALSEEEIQLTIQDYKNAAQNAKEAGFDGVEIHAANGYLPAQFLEDGSNQRSDRYGGSTENRARFLLEVTQAAISVWGSDLVSVRLSPGNPFNGMSDTNPEKTYLYLIEELEKKGLGILHFMESVGNKTPLAPKIRKVFKKLFILNSGYTLSSAEQAIASGLADAISFGSLFISNPDLPERFAQNKELSLPDRSTFYAGTEKGYTDYPFS